MILALSAPPAVHHWTCTLCGADLYPEDGDNVKDGRCPDCDWLWAALELWDDRLQCLVNHLPPAERQEREERVQRLEERERRREGWLF